ncbi:hypothetical protein [Cellulophaga omnivescoria]|uniref:hypothetical protein n=1 Tax=Cellulophaga omnivescoria TaxID=1888890 RepID=UPI0022EFE6C7|nr:hypothetical protein [Cellulophaga omnivescoria]WBU89241.1 hypothetical protein PBN93_15385 [Cellulophaga omnivescoria]
MNENASGSEKSQEEIEKLAQQAESGAHKIYPILKPGDWVGIKAGAVKSNFIGTDDDLKVVIGFGYDTPNDFIFLTHKHLEKLDPDAVLKEAFKNLEEFETEFTALEKLDNKVLTSSGLDFCSERILSSKHMRKAHEMLDAEEILVSIPRRTCMMAVSRHADATLLGTFVNLHVATWEDDSYGNAPISNLLFVLKEGQIVGTIPIDK